MDCDLVLFLIGFGVCAAGILFALIFDVGMDRAAGWLKRIF